METTPFDIPELRHRISLFSTVKDALSCALVSRAWTDNYISVIWFKIDFDVHPWFVGLPPDIVAKHGHRIRIVENAKLLCQVTAIANAGVHSLRELHIEVADSTTQHIRAYEVVFRNSSSLVSLHLFAATPSPKNRESLAHFIPTSVFAPSPLATRQCPSKLKTLQITKLRLTHDGLVAILQLCPSLNLLHLGYTDVVGTPTLPYQHTGLKNFGSNLKSLFPTAPTTGPSLLSYFPCLTTLLTWSTNPVHDTQSAMIKEDLLRYCPDVTVYHIGRCAYTTIPMLCAHVAENMTEVAFGYGHVSIEMITAVLLHQASLRGVVLLSKNDSLRRQNSNLPPLLLLDHFKDSSQMLQLIPRKCPRLEKLVLPSHEMNMDEVEMGEWACKDLKTLQIRVKDLDTEDKILRTIALWRKGCWRRWQKKAGTPVPVEAEQDPMDNSIEARVARHLLKFEKLWSVWLGYQIWMPV